MPAARTPRIPSFVPWLLLTVIGLIVYGSLYPFSFKADATQGGVLALLRELSWARAGRGDRVSNVLLYLPLGFCLFLWLQSRFHRAAAIALAVALGAALSFIIEIAQVYVSARVPSLTDLTLNTLGTVLGAAGGLTWHVLSRLMYLPPPPRTGKSARDPSAAILIVLWLAWRLAPFAPHIDLAKLKAALRPLADPQIDAGSIFTYLAYWLAVSQATAAVASQLRQLEALLILIACVLIGQLVVADQAFIPSELIALVLLMPLAVLMHWLTPIPRRLVLVVAITSALIFNSLAPFDFTATSTHFDLSPLPGWPALGAAAALQSFDWIGLLGKAFVYAAVLWAIKECGVPIKLALGIVTALVLSIEVLQLRLPERTSSVMDPLLALLVGLLLRFVHQRARRRAPVRAREALDDLSS
jgi:VanZ family protein